ncbi:MAG: hypothetical protein LBT04_01535 [Prevotellaceae bacterium]|jgi:hypothetical protein|nr:hypothetical protein [Prevotellaceae bacterium]
MSESELLKRIAELETQNLELKKENRRLRESLGLPSEEAQVNEVLQSVHIPKNQEIDDRIVWYGSINLLSFGSSEESIMRLDSREIAVELTEIAGKNEE